MRASLASLLRDFWPEIALAAAALVLLCLGIAKVPLLDPDEARYAAASRGMLDRGDLVVPWFNGAERLNKPALFYWLQAASFRVLGPSSAAARVPSILSALGVLLGVYLFARKEFCRDAARRSGFILLSCPLFAVVGKTGITDMLLCLCVVSALLFWFRLYRGRGNRTVAWVAVSLSLGLAFFVKGPVGVLMTGFVIAAFLVIRGDWHAFRPKGILLGAALGMMVFLPWSVLLVHRLGREALESGARGGAASRAESRGTEAQAAETSKTRVGGAAGRGEVREGEESSTDNAGQTTRPYTVPDQEARAQAVPGHASPIETGSGHPSLLRIIPRGVARAAELLRRETVDRTVSGMDHPEPFYYFLIAGSVVFLPWSVFFPFVLARSWREIRDRDPATLYLVTWGLGVLVFFSFISGKLPTYILPAAPPLALLLGREWSRLRGTAAAVQAPAETAARPGLGMDLSGRQGTSSLWVVCGVAVLVAAIAGLLVFGSAASPPWWISHRGAIAALAAVIVAAALGPLLARRPGAVSHALSAAMIFAIATVSVLAANEVAARRSLRDLALEAGIADRPWSRVVSYKLSRPSLVYYGHREVTIVDTPADLRRQLDPQSLVILEERRFQAFHSSWQDAFRIVAAQGPVLAIAPVGPLPAYGPAGPKIPRPLAGKGGL